MVLKADSKEENWKPGESLLHKLEAMGVVKEVFPLHGTKLLLVLCFKGVLTLGDSDRLH